MNKTTPKQKQLQNQTRGKQKDQTKSKRAKRIKHLNLEYPTTATTNQYVQSKTRNFEYQLGSKTVLELTGNQKKRTVISPPRDVKQFISIRLYKQPNTLRTLIPELNPLITYVTHRKKSPNGLRFNGTSLEFFYISNVGLSPPTRRFISKYHLNTFNFTDKPRYEKPKSSIRMTAYEKYTNTTQITNLPGGTKRSADDINDDSHRSFRKCSNRKMINEHCSNVACLPGSKINTINLRPLYKLFARKANYDIFHLQTEQTKSQKRLYATSYFCSSRSTASASTIGGLKRSSSKNKSAFERFE